MIITESNKRIRKFIVLALSLVLALSSVSFSFAKDEQEEKQDKLDKVQDEKDTVYKEMNDLAKKIDKQQRALEKVRKAIDKKEKEIKKIEKSLAIMKKKIKKRKAGLNNRIRTMYKNGVIGYLDIILNSGDVTELITNIDMVQKIYEADQETLDTLVEQRMQIEAQEASLKQEKEALSKKQAEYSEKKKALNETQDKLNEKYKKLKAEEDKLQAEIEAIIKAKQVAAGDGSVVALPGKYKGGKWICPVAGRYTVTSEFMARRSYERHPGMDLAGPTGTPIVAAAKGTVILAGWHFGYGKAVIISHGSGLTSLYGHNSSIMVKVGQRVKQGQRIASMGSTGFSTGPHCHFEVKKNGVLQNPRNYCKI